MWQLNRQQLVDESLWIVLLHESGAAVFFCPKFGAVGKKYIVFAGLR